MPLDRILRSLIAWQRAEGPPVPVRALTVEQARERYRASAVRPRRDGVGPAAAVTTRERTVEAHGSALRVRVYTPDTDHGRVVTYLHGGGWSLGDLDSHDWLCRVLAASAGAVVVSADYRRAPEFGHPAPLHDALAAFRWTAREFGGREHVLGGDSAGASLALGAALRSRDAGDPLPSALLLLYPPVDPSLRIAAAGEHTDGYLLTLDDMAWHWELYLPDPADRSDPVVDLLNATLTGLPPTVVATAEYDLLHDEGVALAGALHAAGVPTRHVPGPGLVHGYVTMLDIVPAAAAGAERVFAELDAVLRRRAGTVAGDPAGRAAARGEEVVPRQAAARRRPATA